MGKKFYTAMLVVAVVASYNVYSSVKSDTMSKLLLSNVEALAFEFDGDNWDSNEHWYNNYGSAWTPILVNCTVTYGVDMGLTYLVTVEGKKVVCATGSGNCFDGSSCSAG